MIVRLQHDRAPIPSMVMLDAQTVRGARYGPTFHEAGGRGGRTIGTKRTVLVEILGLPVAAQAISAGRTTSWPGVRSCATASPICHGSRRSSPIGPTGPGHPGPAAPPAPRHQGTAQGRAGLHPLWPLDRVEHAFAQLGRWRRLSRCNEGTEASATAWLQVASVAYLLWRAVG